ncbi:hypothetical protein [Polyangium sp. y55x31]|uniref:hypothetical protein n=1 Tax=Polyangium sp. y55x31 TaxID=3042688 RepID=UPI002482D463|nr:hypothetical protein [Polyangium sp. y55x31]MDI1484144.1 hypothetical protein [Polyangium sp. y55x31]
MIEIYGMGAPEIDLLLIAEFRLAGAGAAPKNVFSIDWRVVSMSAHGPSERAWMKA